MSGASVALALFGIVLAGVISLAWVIADRVIRPRRMPPTEILEQSSGRVRLRRTALSSFPGPLGLLVGSETRHLPLGEIVDEDESSVTRLIDEETAAPSLGRVVADPFGSAEDAGLAIETVSLQGEGVSSEAWVLRGSASSTAKWAILVHGAMSGKASMLRVAKSFRNLGYTSLAVSYRGDEDALPTVKASTLGQTEWADIEPAVQYAKNNGAETVVLVGVSLGATVTLTFCSRSSIAADITGLVLVAPMVDWSSSIRNSVRAARLPTFVAHVSMWLMSRKPWSSCLGLSEPIRFRELDFTLPGKVHVPILILHAQGDPIAPYEASRRMRLAAPHDVTLMPFDGADHALEWNRDQLAFDRAIRDWLPPTSPADLRF